MINIAGINSISNTNARSAMTELANALEAANDATLEYVIAFGTGLTGMTDELPAYQIFLKFNKSYLHEISNEFGTMYGVSILDTVANSAIFSLNINFDNYYEELGRVNPNSYEAEHADDIKNGIVIYRK